MAENRRLSTRHDVDLPCTVTDGDSTVLTRITNLSTAGAFIVGPRLAMGHVIQLAFRVATLDDVIRTAAEVRWSTDRGTGVQFDGLRAKDVWALTKYFETL